MPGQWRLPSCRGVTRCSCHERALAGANIHANNNNLSSNLNSRVIQMVIDKNLTLADAYRLLGLLWTNKTGNVTAFPFFATSEFYTLGFAWEVSKLVANTSVANSGNFTASPPAPPPKNWWDAVWNTITGVFQYVWNAVQAVLVFFSNAVKWLANVAIGLTIGLTTGNWTYFENNVVQPFKRALEVLIQFFTSLVSSLVNGIMNSVLGPIISAGNRLLSGLFRGMLSLNADLISKKSGTEGRHLISAFVSGTEFELIFGLILAVALILVSVAIVTLPVSFILNIVIGIVIGIIASAILSATLSGHKNGGAVTDGPLDLIIRLVSNLIRTGQFNADPLGDQLDRGATIFDAIATGLSGAFAIATKDPSGIVALVVSLIMAVISGWFFAYTKGLPDTVRDPSDKSANVAMLAVSIISLVLDVISLKKPAPDALLKYVKYTAFAFATFAIFLSIGSLAVP